MDRSREYELIFTEYEDEVFGGEERDPYESDREYAEYLANDPYEYIGFDYEGYDLDRKLKWHLSRKNAIIQRLKEEEK